MTKNGKIESDGIEVFSGEKDGSVYDWAAGMENWCESKGGEVMVKVWNDEEIDLSTQAKRKDIGEKIRQFRMDPSDSKCHEKAPGYSNGSEYYSEANLGALIANMKGQIKTKAFMRTSGVGRDALKGSSFPVHFVTSQ